jgi:hypothetical protein
MFSVRSGLRTGVHGNRGKNVQTGAEPGKTGKPTGLGSLAVMHFLIYLFF